MARKRRIVDARADSEGDISHVRFAGNSRFTSIQQAIPMADRGEIEHVHTVRRSNAKPHLRTNRDDIQCNNLDDMAGDK